MSGSVGSGKSSGSKGGSRPSGVSRNVFDPFSRPIGSPTGRSNGGSKPSSTSPSSTGSTGSGTSTTTTTTITNISGSVINPSFVPFGIGAQRQGVGFRRKRKSGQGRRIFDIADEPFGKVAVGLGFFVEARRGQGDSIESVLGIPDEPLTRQERQARERLGVGGGRGRTDPSNFSEGFELGDFFG